MDEQPPNSNTTPSNAKRRRDILTQLRHLINQKYTLFAQQYPSEASQFSAQEATNLLNELHAFCHNQFPNNLQLYSNLLYTQFKHRCDQIQSSLSPNPATNIQEQIASQLVPPPNPETVALMRQHIQEMIASLPELQSFLDTSKDMSDKDHQALRQLINLVSSLNENETNFSTNPSPEKLYKRLYRPIIDVIKK
jgi:hypothetical protein